MLVPVDDPQALASGIDQVLSNPEVAQNLVKTGLAGYTAQFSESVVVRRYLDFFDQVAA